MEKKSYKEVSVLEKIIHELKLDFRTMAEDAVILVDLRVQYLPHQGWVRNKPELRL